MLKQEPTISAKNAEKLIYDMVKYSDHLHQGVRTLSNAEIQRWFIHNNYSWKDLIAKLRNPANSIPLVENLLNTGWNFQGSNWNTVSIIQNGHEMSRLVGSGHVSMSDYTSKFEKALQERKSAIKNGSYPDLLSCITHGIVAIESFITGQANLWNKDSKSSKFDLENSKLNEKLNNWLFIMTGFQLNQAGTPWNHFSEFKNINNDRFKHTSSNSQASSYNEMVKLINNFRTGIAKILFILHNQFKLPIPSKIIRAIYLPNIINM